ncbi:MAG TPA: amidohydrolase [Candidatus Limnocylindrales bacterium]|nr:amidohydrolase [Candidatus Limnocylindrales bacterium]
MSATRSALPALADVVVRGRIVTLEGLAGLGLVEAIAVAGDRIIAAGSTRDIESFAGPRTRSIELPPELTAMPGMTDAHLHLADAAIAEDHLDLSTATTLAQGLALLADYAGPRPRGWLQGHGWDADRWGGWPTADQLETVAPGRKVALWAHDHHALWVSHAAMAAGSVAISMPDPQGGLVRRDAAGQPTGLLHETAARLVSTRIPPPSADDLVSAIARFAVRLEDAGIVAVQDPGSVIPDPDLAVGLPAYRRLAETGGLRLRVDVSLRQEALPEAIRRGLRSGASIGPDGAGVRIGWLKLFADGTLGSRTAAMLEPYDVQPGTLASPGDGRGIFLTGPDELRELASTAASAGIAAQVHAIGDRAVRAALDALEPTAGASSFHPRVEHVQLVDPADLGRFAAAGIAASVQPVHLRSDMPAAATAWGSRVERGGYPWRSLADDGALIPFGTDAPVEPWDPWPGIEMAVTRTRVARSADRGDGPTSLARHEGLDLARALRAACIDGARSAGELDRGSLGPGMRADLIVVPTEALAPEVEPGGPLGRCRPTLVIIGGRVVVER